MTPETRVFDAEAERSKIIKLLKENTEAESNKDIEGALKLYDPKVYTLAPGMKLLRGHADLEGLYKVLLESLVSMDNQVMDIQFSGNGDMAYLVSSYHMVMTEEDGTHHEVGKFLAVLSKKTGEWKIAAISYNTDSHQ